MITHAELPVMSICQGRPHIRWKTSIRTKVNLLALASSQPPLDPGSDRRHRRHARRATHGFVRLTRTPADYQAW